MVIIVKIFALLILCCLLLTACVLQGNESSGVVHESDVSSAVSSTQSEESIISKTGVFGTPVPNKTDIKSGEFVKITEIDQKYLVKSSGGYTYLSMLTPQLMITGFPYMEENNNQLYRLRIKDKDKYSANNAYLAWSTAGGQIRFRTTAESIKIDVKLQYSNAGMKHFAPSGISGIDVYVGTGTDRRYKATIQPTSEPLYSGTISLGAGTKEVLINLPLYAGIAALDIGFPESAKIAEPLTRIYEKPIVFYGSSITQGGCASRPGTAYFNILSRALDANIINLGFSGSAFGETSIAEYIASVELSAFVFDYDYNADTYEKLNATHYPFYEIVRAAHPDIPIIFVSRCNYDEKYVNDVQTRKLIKANWEKAKAAGDKNVYFVDGSLFFEEDTKGDFTVDGLHPTDLGFRAMAEGIFPVLKEALEK